MATTKSKVTELPLIQIDDLVREMTPEEYAIYLAEESAFVPLPTGE